MVPERNHHQLTPGVFLGSYSTLLNNEFLNLGNVKVVVNCGGTGLFLHFLNLQHPILSSDIIVLNLDPYILSDDEEYKEFHGRFNRVLQNYWAFFFHYNADVKYYINSNFEGAHLTFDSPTINGMPLKLLFKVNRLLKLIRNMNTSVGVLFISENFGSMHNTNGLLFALAMLYLMDCYNYNFESSYKYLQSVISPCFDRHEMYDTIPDSLFNFNHYDDMLLVDSLKKFYAENSRIKQIETGVMTRHRRLKRSRDSFGPQAVKRVA